MAYDLTAPSNLYLLTLPWPSSSKNHTFVVSPSILNPDDSKIPPEAVLWPECGLYNAFAKLIVYFVELPIVGKNDFLNLTVVIFERILSSVLSIKPVSFENLNIVSKDCKVFVL